ncbi:MAG: tRNA epoxyqueuosine(34) reductase QueG [Candidatus Kapaibacteriales bacterium]
MLSPKAKENLKIFIKSLGFCEVGFARVEKLSIEFSYYLKWLEYGYHSNMKYLERNLDKRVDPNVILPNAKTMIVCAYSYNTPYNRNSDDFKISKYAWGDDYHNVILPLLKKIEDKLTEIEPLHKSKSYVDTGSILEKAWAVRAGIGWMGKNSLVISKKFGSYIFLGVIITTVEIPADSPIADYCGKCTKCIDSCPTGAIVEPKVVDSRRCISYWTIEAKANESIPDVIDLNNWLFGCDICQEVCPWNRKAYKTNELAFAPKNSETSLTKEFLSNLDEETFRIRFKNSPLKRAKLAGIQRNFRHILKRTS